MRLVEIDNSNRTTEIKINNDQLGKFISEKCPIAYNSPVNIYRGINLNKKFMFGDSRLFERQSKNTANYYTLLMSDILNNWKDYPKRSRSFICTTSFEMASNYGNIFQVFPVGDPLIGICPRSDLWFSFNNISLDNFYIIFNSLNSKLGYKFKGNLLDFKTQLKQLDKDWIIEKNIAKKDYEGSIFQEMVGIIEDSCSINETYIKEFNSFTEVLANLLSPEENNFTLTRLSNLSIKDLTDKRSGNELWFSGPAYFLNINNEL